MEKNYTGGGKYKEPPESKVAAAQTRKPYHVEPKASYISKNSLDILENKTTKPNYPSQIPSSTHKPIQTQISAAQVYDQAKANLKPTETNTTDVTKNVNNTQGAIGGTSNEDLMVTVAHKMSNYRGSEQPMSDEDDDNNGSATAEAKFTCLIASEDGFDLTTASRIAVAGELGKSISKFRLYRTNNKCLKIELENNLDLEALKKLKTLYGHNVTVQVQTLQIASTTHSPNIPTADNSRTISWGKIFSEDLLHSSDEEILYQLQQENANILSAKKITRMRNGSEVITRLVKIKFNSPTIPEKVYCLAVSHNVILYIPPPKKCKKCK